MDDEESQLIHKEVENKEDISVLVSRQHVVNLAGDQPEPPNQGHTSSPPSNTANEAQMPSQSATTENSRLESKPTVGLPSMPPGIAPPTYQQAIQQESVPTRDQQAVPNEPPPEYTGPSPGYDASQTTSGHFHGESTMSTAEEQERTNAMEDGIGRLLVLQSIVRAIEERNAQNSNGLQGSNQAQAPCQRIIRTPFGTIIATDNTSNNRSSVQSQTTTATTAPNRPITTAPTITQPIVYRQQAPRSGARDALMTYRMIRCCVVICIAVVVAIAAGIGASQHSSSDTDDDYYSNTDDNYHSSSSSASSSDNQCLYNLCENGGRCSETGGETKCFCATGYGGTFCTDHVQQKCIYNSCSNGGTCWIEGPTTYCKCPEGYGGDFCDESVSDETDQCSYMVCENGGTCHTGYFWETCKCPEGFSGYRCQLTRTTKPTKIPNVFPLTEPFLLFTEDSKQTKAAFLDGTHSMTILNSGRYVDFDYRKRNIFVASVGDNSKILLTSLDSYVAGGTAESKIIMNDLQANIQSIAYDWINSNIYWTDGKLQQITVMHIQTGFRKPLIKADIGELSPIAVDPRDEQRWLYYVEEGFQLKKAGLDGSNNHTLFTLNGPFYLVTFTIDFQTNKLYYVRGDKLEFANLDGSKGEPLLTSSFLTNRFSIVQFGDFIYWTYSTEGDPPGTYIKYTSKNRLTWTDRTYMVMHRSYVRFEDIQVFDSSRQPNATAVCGDNNGACEQLCLPTPHQTGSTEKYVCACSEGMILGSGGFTCEQKG